MASKSTTLTVKILTDASQATKGAAEAASGFDKFSSRIDSLVAPAAAVTGALALVGTAAVNSASRTEQAMGALDSVFGKNADTVKGWAATAADSVGLAESEYAELASTIGAQLNNMGLSTEAALSGTQDLIGLGADLAATFGGTTTEAVEALSSALRGEADPAERYGLSLNQTAVNAKLAEEGMSGLTGEALKTAQTQAILTLATEQAGGAIGQFGRESDTASGQQQRLTAQFENASSALGDALLPIITTVTASLADMAKWVSQNSTLVLTFAGIIGGLAAAIIVVSAAMKAYGVVMSVVSNWSKIQSAATAVATAAQWLYNAALTANPIGLLIAAIVVIIGLIIYLWTTNEGFRDAVIAIWESISSFVVTVWEAIVQAAQVAWEWILSIVGAVVDFIVGYAKFVLSIYVAIWNAIATAAVAVWNWILSIINAVINGLIAYIRNAQAVVLGVWNAIRTAANIVWKGILAVVNGVINSIRSAVSSVGSFINGIWQGILNAGRTVWKTLESIVSSVMAAIMVPINAVRDAFESVVSVIQDIISWISRIKIPDVLGGLGDLVGLSASAAVMVPAAASVTGRAGFASPSLSAAGGVLSASRGGLTINVNGGLDSSDTIARRIRSILDGRDRRTGGVVIERRVK